GIIARVTKADGTVLGGQPGSRADALAAAAIAAAAPTHAAAPQESERPDFSGVYYPYTPGSAAAPARPPRSGEPLPPPTRSAPTSDGSQGRGPNAPKLTPEYLEQWNAIAASRIAGSYETDNIANCLPPGMPAM